MKTIKVSLIVLMLLLFLDAGAQREQFSTVKIYLPFDKAKRAALIGLLQIDHFQETGDGAIVSEISAHDLAKLKTTSYRYEILIDDVARHLEELNRQYYEKRARAGNEERLALEQTGSTVDNIIPTPSAFVVQSTFGGYYSFAQMNSAMNALVAAYPAIAQKTSLGLSTGGRDIWCIKISDNVATDETNEPEVLYIGLQHAREAIGGSSMLFFMQYLCENYATDQRIRDLVDNREIFIIPCMNPDGWEYNRNNGGAGSGWRKNRRNNGDGSFGVDLNRNWGIDWGNCNAPITGNPSSCGSNDSFDDTYYGPSAFSEPETKAIRDFTYAHHLTAMIDQHSYGPYYSLPFGRPSLPSNTMSTEDSKFYTYISAAMGNYNGMRSGNSPQSVGYEVAGGVKDWMLKGNIGTGSKGKVYGMTGEGGAGGGSGGMYGSFWAPADQIIHLCKGMVYQNLQLLFAAGSYVNLQDQTDIALNLAEGSFDFHLRRVGLEDRPVTVSLIPIENIESAGSPVTIGSLENYYDTVIGSVNYTLPASLANGSRIRYAWKIETGGYTWYDTITKFYNPVVLFADDMEGASVTTNWTVTNGWNYSTDRSYRGNKSLAESPAGNYTANSTRRATYNGTLNLADATAAWISFWVRHRAENFYDKLQVQVSSNGGVSWTAIAGSTTIQETGTLDGSTINGNPSLTGIKEEWTRELFNLGAYLGVSNLQFRFEFTSGPTSGYDFSEDEGFNIDNLKIIKSTTPMISLPVHFISFTAKPLQNKTVQLDWTAVTDQEHDYFEAERSANGIDFHSIGRSPSTANRMIDLSPLTGNNFYRIKQVDKDGTVTYSNIANVYFSASQLVVMAYPNPVSGIVNIKLNDYPVDRYTVSLTDLTGRKIYENKIMAGSGTALLQADLLQHAAQIYLLVVRNSRNEIVATGKIARE